MHQTIRYVRSRTRRSICGRITGKVFRYSYSDVSGYTTRVASMIRKGA